MKKHDGDNLLLNQPKVYWAKSAYWALREGEDKMIRVQTKRCLISEVEPGMELASSVMTDVGNYALGDGTVLTTSLIERLKLWGVDVVNIRTIIDESAAEPIEITETLKAFSSDYNDMVFSLKKSFETVRFFKQVPLVAMKEMADTKVADLIDTPGILNHLHAVQRKDDYTFSHSMNVAVICGMIGRWLGYTGQECKNLVLAGLLHDIGKTQIPMEIIRKPSALSPLEMDTMKLHSTRGFKLIKELELPSSVLYAVLQHHEREDGSGYPLQVTGDKIHPFAKIVAVADVYDAITSDTTYRQKVTPFQAVDTLVQEMYHLLDPAICSVFLNNVRDYFIGNVVELSDKRVAEVVYLGQVVAARPIVRTTDGEFIDLEKNKRISIARIVSS